MTKQKKSREPREEEEDIPWGYGIAAPDGLPSNQHEVREWRERKAREAEARLNPIPRRRIR